MGFLQDHIGIAMGSKYNQITDYSHFLATGLMQYVVQCTVSIQIERIRTGNNNVFSVIKFYLFVLKLMINYANFLKVKSTNVSMEFK